MSSTNAATTGANANSFRKIDIDVYDEDRFLEDDELVLSTAEDSTTDTTTTTTTTTNNNSNSNTITTSTTTNTNNNCSVEEMEKALGVKEGEVRVLLNKMDYKSALRRALQDSPIGKDPTHLKEGNLKIVMDVLGTVKINEIPGILKDLDKEEQDMIVKFIYKAMAFPILYNPSILLSWHEKAIELVGYGSILRVLTDRKPL